VVSKLDNILINNTLKSLNCLKQQYLDNCKTNNNCNRCELFDDFDGNSLDYINNWIDIIQQLQKENETLSIRIKELDFGFKLQSSIIADLENSNQELSDRVVKAEGLMESKAINENDSAICGATNLPCCYCQPCCGHRKEM